MTGRDMTTERTSAKARRALLIILLVGIALRVVVFSVLSPRNNDDHFAVIEFIHANHAPPITGTLDLAHDPPLYHVLAALLLPLGGIKTVQTLSLVFSIATLGVMAALLARLPWLDEKLLPWCLALPAFHPQFVIYNLFVSNDTLAILIGTLLFYQAARCLEQPSLRRQLWLAVILGVGGLTKFTFLAFCGPVALFLLLLNAGTLPKRAQAVRLAALLSLAAVVGSYKFVENAIFHGQPFINTLDFDPEWAQQQRPTWIGIRTVLDVNILELVRRPIITRFTAHSWPLTLYGSFWYSFIPESSFRTNLTPLRFLGSVIYVFALAPTLLMMAGAAIGARALTRSGLPKAAPLREEGIFFVYASTILVMTLLLLTAAAWRYDLWSMFQGRLLFPAYFSLVVLLYEGMRLAERRRAIWLVARCAMAALYLCFFVYIVAEIQLSIVQPVSPMQRSFMPYRINMTAPLSDG